MEGKCLCGAVSLTTQDKQGVGICHCGMCRRWGSGPMFAIESEAISLSGEEHVVNYRSSEWAERAFCKVCGTHLYYRFVSNGYYAVAAGLFDMPGLQLTGQIYIDHKPEYYAFANETPTMTEEQVMQAYAGKF